MSQAEIAMMHVIGDRLSSLEQRISQSDQASSTSRAKIHQELESLGRTCLAIDLRVQAAEKALALASPTLQEVVDTKLKVKAGGIVAWGLWKVGVLLIGAVAFLYTFWDRVDAVMRALFHAPK